MIKAVIFDLDDTLYDYELLNDAAIENAGIWLCKQTGISYDKFISAFENGRHKTKEFMRDCASQHNRIIYFQKMSEILGFNPIKYSIELYEKYWSYILNNMQLVPYARQLIERLCSENIKIAICTALADFIAPCPWFPVHTASSLSNIVLPEFLHAY